MSKEDLNRKIHAQSQRIKQLEEALYLAHKLALKLRRNYEDIKNNAIKD